MVVKRISTSQKAVSRRSAFPGGMRGDGKGERIVVDDVCVLSIISGNWFAPR